MANFSGFALGTGREGSFQELARERAVQEKRDALMDRLAQAQNYRANRELGLREQQQQFGQRLSSAAQPLGAPIQQADGGLVQTMIDPLSGKLSTIPLGVDTLSTPEKLAVAYQRVAATQGKDVADKLFGRNQREDEASKQAADFAAAQAEALKLGFQPGSKQFNEYVAGRLKVTGPEAQRDLFGLPLFNPYANPFFGFGGGGSTFVSDADRQNDAMMMAAGKLTNDDLRKKYEQLGKAGGPIVADITNRAQKMGWNSNMRLSPTAQNNLMKIAPTLDQTSRLLKLVDMASPKDASGKVAYSNQPLALLWPRIQYAAGRGQLPKELLESHLGDFSLGSVVEAAAALQGSSRSVTALKIALEHTPNPYVDSPLQIHNKLRDIRNRLVDVVNETKKYGTKSGLAPMTPENYTIDPGQEDQYTNPDTDANPEGSGSTMPRPDF